MIICMERQPSQWGDCEDIVKVMHAPTPMQTCQGLGTEQLKNALHTKGTLAQEQGLQPVSENKQKR